MKKMNKLCLLLPLFSLFGCSYNQNEISTYDVLPYQEDMIVLQNLQTRVLAYCYTSPSYTAEYCAKEFEGKGFVRLTDIPRMTADHDVLKGNTYPTRRWRKEDQVPRW